MSSWDFGDLIGSLGAHDGLLHSPPSGKDLTQVNGLCYHLRQMKVVVAINYIGSSGRRQLSGVLAYLDAAPHDWYMRPVGTEQELADEIEAVRHGRGADGFIVGRLLSDRLRRRLMKVPLPIVAVNLPPPLFAARPRGIAFVYNDNDGIGSLAARHLASLGSFRSFAHISAAEANDWSETRSRAFAATLSAKGVHPKRYRSGPLAEFLKHLEKPAAVFVSHDQRALDVMESAQVADVKIPEQMVVLGVDDDEIFCRSTKPTLSSIRPDNESVGYRAAEAIDQMLSGKKIDRGTILIKPRTVIDRDSTHPPKPAAYLVTRALEFIAAEATNGIGPDDVARHLNVSRRLLDLRFHELERKTVARAICNQKLCVFRKLLRETKKPATKLAAQCGFTNINALRNLFRRTYGRPIGAYRK